MPNEPKRLPTSRTVKDRAAVIKDLREFSSHWSLQIKQWEKEGNGGSAERKYAHQYWIDLLACFGYRGTRLDLFEYDTPRASTRQPGRVDIFIPGVLIGEIKSLHVNLNNADVQIWDYLRGGGIPPSDYPIGAISTNFKKFHVFKTRGATGAVKFDLADLPSHFDELKFLLNSSLQNRNNNDEKATGNHVFYIVKGEGKRKGAGGGGSARPESVNVTSSLSEEDDEKAVAVGCAFIILLMIAVLIWLFTT